MGQHTIIGFTYGERQEELNFQARVDQALNETAHALMRDPHKLHDASRVIIRVQSENTPEHFCAVYYLDAAAMAMCQDLGLTLPIIGKTDKNLDHLRVLVAVEYLPRAK